MTFGHREYAEERSRADADLQGQCYGAQLKRSEIAQIAAVGVGCRRGFAQPQPTLKPAGAGELRNEPPREFSRLRARGLGFEKRQARD